MTKPELIDAVKRWQVAVVLIPWDYWGWGVTAWECVIIDDFIKTTNTFIELLEQIDEEDIEPDSSSDHFSDMGRFLPILLNWPDSLSEQPAPRGQLQWVEEPTDPGVGFGG